MYVRLLCLSALLTVGVQTAAEQSAQAQTSDRALTAALLGRWVGVLEYRDYSEPPTSTKRVQLPAWLTIRPVPEGVFLESTYDDGPSKRSLNTRPWWLIFNIVITRRSGQMPPWKRTTLTILRPFRVHMVL